MSFFEMNASLSQTIISQSIIQKWLKCKYLGGGSNQFCRYLLLLPPHFHQPLPLCNGYGVQIFLLYTKVNSSNKGLGRYSDFLMTIHWDNFHSCHHNKEKDSRGLLKAQTTIYYYTSPTFILRIMPIYLSQTLGQLKWFFLKYLNPNVKNTI